MLQGAATASLEVDSWHYHLKEVVNVRSKLYKERAAY